MRNDFYVYVLLDPRKPGDYQYGSLRFKHEPFYVGKGKGNRDASHFRPGNIARDAKTQKNTHKVNKIRKIVEAGFYPAPVRIKSDVTEIRAFELEVKAIRLIGRGKHGPLVNCTDGGEGTSGYILSAAQRLAKQQWAQAFHAGLSDSEKAELKEKVRLATLKWMEDMPIEKRLEWAANISKAAAKRTPKERELLQQKFREIQLSLPERVQKAKNRKVSTGNKRHHEGLTEEQRKEFRDVRSKGAKRYWANTSEDTRTKRAEAIAAGYAKKSPKSLAQKNAKISGKIAEQHAKQTPFESRMRSFMVMCGVMLKNAGKGDDVTLKENLRARGTRFYSKKDNLDKLPSVLREKVRVLIAA